MPLILGRTTAAARDFGFARRVSHSAGELITYSGDGHLITLAPTGTGKTSGPVICNALTHPGQLIVIDMKGDVHAATAQARRTMGQEVHALDLRDDAQAAGSLNPLDLAVMCGTDPATLARSLATEIVERGADERDRYWNDAAESLITGALAWLIDDCPKSEARLSAVFDLFTSDDPVYTMARDLDQNKIRNRAARAVFASFLNLPSETTRPCVLSMALTHLRLFDADTVRRVTDTTTFDLDAFAAGKPMTIYVIVPPMRLHAYSPLLRLWLSGLILSLTERTTAPENRTLMLVDEAGNLGKIDALLTATTLLRSWGLTLWSFWQNAAQLSIYGSQANTLVDNAGVVQVFGARNHRMAQEVANLIGGVSPEEILRMPRSEQILLIEGRSIRCGQVRHYSDSLFISAEA